MIGQNDNFIKKRLLHTIALIRGLPAAEVICTNDLRALLSNSLMTEQLSIVNALRKWEPLDTLTFESSTGKYTLYRPNGKQQYEGTLDGSKLTSTFNSRSKWTAKKSATGSQ